MTMDHYAIRIELNGKPSADTYQRLHEVLASMNVYRLIWGDGGQLYEMPHATYVASSALEAEAVRDIIVRNVQPIWQNCDIIVFRYRDAAWQLSPVYLPQAA